MKKNKYLNKVQEHTLEEIRKETFWICRSPRTHTETESRVDNKLLGYYLHNRRATQVLVDLLIKFVPENEIAVKKLVTRHVKDYQIQDKYLPLVMNRWVKPKDGKMSDDDLLRKYAMHDYRFPMFPKDMEDHDEDRIPPIDLLAQAKANVNTRRKQRMAKLGVSGNH